MPTDLLGFTAASYDPDWAKTNANAALGAAITLVKQAIDASSWAELRLDIRLGTSCRTQLRRRAAVECVATAGTGAAMRIVD
jgi:hypothetical protein